ncbi:MAG: transposase [Rhodobacteraceae bacterium]|nr:transposase [Paracoccaceae bacterium]
MRVHVTRDGNERLTCPEYGCRCPEHVVITVKVLWQESTVRFEALVTDWLGEAIVSAVHRLLGVSWNAIDGIRQRAVTRGLERWKEEGLTHLCVDGTSFGKRHDHGAFVSGHVGGKIMHFGEGRRKDTLDQWCKSLPYDRLHAIESVSMDMWPACINPTLKHVPDDGRKIAFDRFRRREHRSLRRMGLDDLKGTGHDWLINRRNMTPGKRRHLRDSSQETTRAWAMRCRLEPMREATGMVEKHLWGIINAVVLKVGNGPAGSLNSRIRMIKVTSRGYRNKQRFIADIQFHMGGLDLYPEGVK